MEDPFKTRKAAHGFTLVELLVVVGIIAILIGILMPVLSRARGSADQVECASNMRQWAMAVNQYATENHNYLPRRGQGVQQPVAANELDRPSDWFNALPPMMRMKQYQDRMSPGAIPTSQDQTMWICPAAQQTFNGFVMTYAMNMWLSTWLTAQPDRIDKVGSNSTMVFLADAPPGFCSVLPVPVKSYNVSPVARHHGYVNLAFLDGHVAAFTSAYVGCGTGDPHEPDIVWAPPDSPWSGPAVGPGN